MRRSVSFLPFVSLPRPRTRLRHPRRQRQSPVWLCKPGIADNPCEPGFDTTVISPTGEPLHVKHEKREEAPQDRLLLRLSHGQRSADR